MPELKWSEALADVAEGATAVPAVQAGQAPSPSAPVTPAVVLPYLDLRRSIMVNSAVYQRLLDQAKREGRFPAYLVDDALHEYLMMRAPGEAKG